MESKEKLLLVQAMKEKAKRDKLKSYQEDFEVFAKDNIKILPKDVSDGLIEFNLNDPQKIIHEAIEKQRKETGKVRVLVLKARQQGISTLFAARTYWRLTQNQFYKAALLAHDQKTSETLFEMTKRIYEFHPEDNRPSISNSSKREMVFDQLKSEYNIYTAGSPQAGRGNTPQILHASEVAFWGKAEHVLAGLFQGVPKTDGTEIILESTANGAQGEFYRLWKEAEAGRGEFIAVFVPWFLSTEYRDKVPEDFERDQEEEDLVELYDLDDEQLMFRRNKISATGVDRFRQEYPSCAEEAFLTSGSTVFDLSKIEDDYVKKEIARETYSVSPRNSFDLDPHGEFQLWEYPEHDKGYIIGADVSFGVGNDYSSAVVMDSDKNILGLYRSNKIQPTDFGEMLYYLGRRFSNALIIVERNGPGVPTLNVLNDMRYNNIYHEVRVAAVSSETTARPGFTTSGSSKPHLIAGLARVVREQSLKIPSTVMLEELRNYLALDNGKMEAADGYHDDTVIAAALCLEGLRTHGDKLSMTVDWSRFREYELASDSNNWL